MQIAFNLDEITLQRIQQAQWEGQLDTPDQLNVPIDLGLSVDAGNHRCTATLKFINNEVDPKTGTTRPKARCDNRRQDPGGRLLTAGMFVRIRVPFGSTRTAILVPETAPGSDQGTRYLFIVRADGRAIRWNLQAGLQLGENREIQATTQQFFPQTDVPKDLTNSNKRCCFSKQIPTRLSPSNVTSTSLPMGW